PGGLPVDLHRPRLCRGRRQHAEYEELLAWLGSESRRSQRTARTLEFGALETLLHGWRRLLARARSGCADDHPARADEKHDAGSCELDHAESKAGGAAAALVETPTQRENRRRGIRDPSQ